MSEVLYLGDVLVTPKDNITNISHYSVYAGKSEDGTDWAIHNNIGTGVSWIPLNQLLKNGYERIDRFVGDMESRLMSINKAVRKIGDEYNLLFYNCEHFATETQTGKPRSFQVRKVILSFVLLALAYKLFFTNQNNSTYKN
jgi:hypothetical protein